MAGSGTRINSITSPCPGNRPTEAASLDIVGAFDGAGGGSWRRDEYAARALSMRNEWNALLETV